MAHLLGKTRSCNLFVLTLFQICILQDSTYGYKLGNWTEFKEVTKATDRKVPKTV